MLNGKVQDADGKPIAGATVTLGDMVGQDGTPYEVPENRTTTDAAGLFSMEGLPAGWTGRMRAHKDGYPMASARQEATSEEVKITLRFGALVRGRVTSVRPVSAGQQVLAELTPEGGSRIGTYGGSTTCKADGAFEFRNVPAGRYVLSALLNPGRADDRGPRKTIEVRPTQPGEVIEVEL
jgi:hypothetical protein